MTTEDQKKLEEYIKTKTINLDANTPEGWLSYTKKQADLLRKYKNEQQK